MELSKILTEDEMSQLSPEVVTKLESAYRAELAKSIESDAVKQRKQVEKMLECVMDRADKMIAEAVADNVSKFKDTAVNDKMYKVLKAISACMESAGISFNDELAQAKKAQRDAEAKLQEAYKELNKSKQVVNELTKKEFIMKQVEGMKPDAVQATLSNFMNPKKDVREITKESIANFIGQNESGGDVLMLDVDADADGELNMANVENALKDINHELDMEEKPKKTQKMVSNGNTLNGKKMTGESRFESLGKGLQPQRVSIPTPNVTLESVDGVAYSNDDRDVADAMNQLQEFAGIGVGKFS
jgi:hypothetical protein